MRRITVHTPGDPIYAMSREGRIVISVVQPEGTVVEQDQLLKPSDEDVTQNLDGGVNRALTHTEVQFIEGIRTGYLQAVRTEDVQRPASVLAAPLTGDDMVVTTDDGRAVNSLAYDALRAFVASLVMQDTDPLVIEYETMRRYQGVTLSISKDGEHDQFLIRIA